VPAQPLNLKERASLLALLAEARPLTNAELHGVAGIKLDGESRRKLNELRLVTSQLKGRAYVHELTEDGAAWCEKELVAERPDRAGSVGGALYAILAGLHRYLQRTGQVLSDVFPPVLDTEIRAAYRRLSTESESSWVGLAALREELADIARSDLDAALQKLSRQPGVHVQAEANQQALTETDRAAAVHFGGSSRHLLKIENA
jgi:hypothetical protein